MQDLNYSFLQILFIFLVKRWSRTFYYMKWNHKQALAFVAIITTNFELACDGLSSFFGVKRLL